MTSLPIYITGGVNLTDNQADFLMVLGGLLLLLMIFIILKFGTGMTWRSIKKEISFPVLFFIMCGISLILYGLIGIFKI